MCCCALWVDEASRAAAQVEQHLQVKVVSKSWCADCVGGRVASEANQDPCTWLGPSWPGPSEGLVYLWDVPGEHPGGMGAPSSVSAKESGVTAVLMKCP